MGGLQALRPKYKKDFNINQFYFHLNQKKNLASWKFLKLTDLGDAGQTLFLTHLLYVWTVFQQLKFVEKPQFHVASTKNAAAAKIILEWYYYPIILTDEME